MKQARSRGFALIVEVFAPGMSAMAAPVYNAQGQAIGVITVAGPATRLPEPRLLALGPTLVQATTQVGQASIGSALFKRQA